MKLQGYARRVFKEMYLKKAILSRFCFPFFNWAEQQQGSPLILGLHLDG
jgi:hypothetical protein